MISPTMIALLISSAEKQARAAALADAAAYIRSLAAGISGDDTDDEIRDYLIMLAAEVAEGRVSS